VKKNLKVFMMVMEGLIEGIYRMTNSYTGRTGALLFRGHNGPEIARPGEGVASPLE